VRHTGFVMRLFVALWPPADVAETLTAAAAAVAVGREGRDIRPTASHRLHLTCAFIGDASGRQAADVSDHLADVAVAHAAIDLALDEGGHFGDRVLWAGPSQPPPELASLAKATRVAIRAAGLTVQGNAFRPHVTLGRVREDAILTPVADRLTELLTADPVAWHADDYCLVSSVRAATSTYEIVERWSLA